MDDRDYADMEINGNGWFFGKEEPTVKQDKCMTNSQHNQFFHILMGKEPELINWLCTDGSIRKDVPEYPDCLSNPKPVLEWMKENMPKALNNFLESFKDNYYDAFYETKALFYWLDLHNLTAYMKENSKWGKCAHDCDACWRRPETREECRKKGTIIHPALKFLRGIE